MLSTTFALAHKSRACVPSYRKMAKALGGIRKYGRDTPFTLARVLDVLGMEDALWCFGYTLPGQWEENQRVLCLFLADVLEHVQDKLTNERSRAVIPLLRRRARGEATDKEMKNAADAAHAASRAAAHVAVVAYAAYRVAFLAYAAHAAYRASTASTTIAARIGGRGEHAWQIKRLGEYLREEV